MASSKAGYKEGSIKVSTFKRWGLEDTLGFSPNGDKVEYIWCKLCSKHKEEINTAIQTKGKVKDNQLSYTKEVRFIKKGNVERHLKGGCHEHALKIEAKLAKKWTNEPSKNEAPNKQPKIDFAMKKTLQSHYEKMFKIAFNLAEGMMPFNKFRVLVKCVRENNVHLISGKDDHRAAEEYVRYIADSIRERLALLLVHQMHFPFYQMGLRPGKQGWKKNLYLSVSSKVEYLCTTASSSRL